MLPESRRRVVARHALAATPCGLSEVQQVFKSCSGRRESANVGPTLLQCWRHHKVEAASDTGSDVSESV